MSALILMPEVILSDIEGAVSDVEGGISIIEGIATIIEGIISDLEGAINMVENFFASYASFIMFVFLILFAVTLFSLLVFIGVMLALGGKNLQTGINNHVKCGSREYNYGSENFFFVVSVLWDCMWQKFVLFMNGQCTVYYIVDIILGIIYAIFIQLPIVLIRAIFGINLFPLVNDIYKITILPLNDLVFLITGFYIVEWPKSVQEKCFLCKGKYKTCSNDTVTLYKTFNEWAQLNKCNWAQMNQGLKKIFQTIIPSEKWMAWMNGQELCGATNTPPF